MPPWVLSGVLQLHLGGLAGEASKFLVPPNARARVGGSRAVCCWGLLVFEGGCNCVINILWLEAGIFAHRGKSEVIFLMLYKPIMSSAINV